MPLNGKEELSLLSLSEDLDPNAEVFYCKITGEAFLTYEEFYERQSLCSSPIWTCSVTGKSGLTYSEALKSERQSQNLLSSIPQVLQKVLLHLITYMDNFSANVTISLLIEYTNLRYFIGEEVFVNVNKSLKMSAIIRDVIPPEEESKTSVAYGMDPLKYNYVVEYRKSPNAKSLLVSENKQATIPASRITRPKCLLNREKIRLFIKQHLSPKGSRYEALSIKEESIINLELDDMKWEDVYKGPLPNFRDDTTIMKTAGKEDSGTLEKVPIITKKGNILAQQKMKQKRREEKYKKDVKKKDNSKKLKGSKKTAKVELNDESESKQTQVERKKKEKEAKRRFEEDLRAYNEKRDDLLCDDLKPLPSPIQFDCSIEDQLLGDSLSIVEFINMFKENLNILEVFPEGISFEMFAKILNDNDVDGPYYDLLRSLLYTLFVSKVGDVEFEGDLVINELKDNINAFQDDEDSDSQAYVNFSNHWVTTYFGTHEQLSKLKIDAFTLTEMLRIYIQKTRKGEFKSKRHGISDQDCQLINRLTLSSVFELSQTQRVQLFTLLMLDVGKISDIRTKMEDSLEEVYRLKNQIRHINASYTRWLRDHPIRQKIRKKRAEAAINDGRDAENAVDDETTEEERDQFRKDRSQREQQMKKSLCELKSKIRQLNSVCHPRPLGVDRAYRRYWIFQSMPGLLVEHPVEEMQAICSRPCLESSVLQTRPQLSNYLPNAKRRKCKPKSKDSSAGTSSQTTDQMAQDVPSLGVFDRCTGENETCAVHGTCHLDKHVRWAFYTKEHIEDLVETLSARGLRESDLRAAINLEMPTIMKNHLDHFNPSIYSRSYVPSFDLSMEDSLEVRKSERILNQMVEKATVKTVDPSIKHIQTVSRYTNLTPFQAQVNALKDLLLSLEINIFDSCFCSTKQEEREEWVQQLQKDHDSNQFKALNNFLELFRRLAGGLKPLCLLPPLSTFHNSSAAPSPSDKENIENNHSIKTPKLSDKWLHVLKLPESFNALNLFINHFESSYGILSFSQLFINVYILEKSINWNLSAMKTANKCKVCRRKANEQMILCDLCNKGYHIYCLVPPIQSVDEIEGDWYCPVCLPRPTQASINSAYSKTKATTENMNGVGATTHPPDDFGEYLKCPVCKKHVVDEYAEVICKTCNHNFHLKCVDLHRVPRSWNCVTCEAKIKFEADQQSSEDENNDVVRRSSRKRKPKDYFDDADDYNERGGAHYGRKQAKRYSPEAEKTTHASFRRTERPRRQATNHMPEWNDNSNESY